MLLPVKSADRMTCKRDDIRAYTEKKYVMLKIIPQDPAKTGKIILNLLHQERIRIIGKPESRISSATYTPVYTRITQLHDKIKTPEVYKITFTAWKRLIKK